MEATLQAEKRDGRGKNEARRLRASGRIPAVVYGTEKNKATEIAVDPKLDGYAGHRSTETPVIVLEPRDGTA